MSNADRVLYLFIYNEIHTLVKRQKIYRIRKKEHRAYTYIVKSDKMDSKQL